MSRRIGQSVALGIKPRDLPMAAEIPSGERHTAGVTPRNSRSWRRRLKYSNSRANGPDLNSDVLAPIYDGTFGQSHKVRHQDAFRRNVDRDSPAVLAVGDQ